MNKCQIIKYGNHYLQVDNLKFTLYHKSMQNIQHGKLFFHTNFQFNFTKINSNRMLIFPEVVNYGTGSHSPTMICDGGYMDRHLCVTHRNHRCQKVRTL